MKLVYKNIVTLEAIKILGRVPNKLLKFRPFNGDYKSNQNLTFCLINYIYKKTFTAEEHCN